MRFWWSRKPALEAWNCDLEAIRHEVRNALLGIHRQHKTANRLVVQLSESLVECRDHLKRIEEALKEKGHA